MSVIDRTENKGNLGGRGKTGETGLRGATGERGATGPRGGIGKRGVIGKQGRKGLRGREGLEGLRGPDHKDDVLDHIVLQFQDVYQQLAELMDRIAQMEQQLHRMAAPRGKRNER
jgi:collagen triple helix repeat protein